MIILDNKRNGFTLIELLAVIAVLSIISVVAGGIIINSLGNAKGDINKIQENNLIDTAKVFFQDILNYNYLNSSGETVDLISYNICIQENLVKEGYLDEFKDDNNNKKYGYIKVKNSDGKYTYKYISGGENNCVPCQPKGDVNRDGIVDTTDFNIAQAYVFKWTEYDGISMSEYSDLLNTYGDVAEPYGKFDTADMLGILDLPDNGTNRACPY